MPTAADGRLSVESPGGLTVTWEDGKWLPLPTLPTACHNIRH
jgi:hypothetical protein